MCDLQYIVIINLIIFVTGSLNINFIIVKTNSSER